MFDYLHRSVSCGIVETHTKVCAYPSQPRDC